MRVRVHGTDFEKLYIRRATSHMGRVLHAQSFRSLQAWVPVVVDQTRHEPRIHVGEGVLIRGSHQVVDGPTHAVVPVEPVSQDGLGTAVLRRNPGPEAGGSRNSRKTPSRRFVSRRREEEGGGTLSSLLREVAAG